MSAGAALVGLTLWLDHMQANFSKFSLHSFSLSLCYLTFENIRNINMTQ